MVLSRFDVNQIRSAILHIQYLFLSGYIYNIIIHEKNFLSLGLCIQKVSHDGAHPLQVCIIFLLSQDPIIGCLNVQNPRLLVGKLRGLESIQFRRVEWSIRFLWYFTRREDISEFRAALKTSLSYTCSAPLRISRKFQAICHSF
jgi:hypothetical protein